MLTVTSYGADGATFRQKFRRQGLFWFFRSLTAGYKLPGIVNQRATSLSAVQLVQGFCFCSLPYTFRYVFVNACAFSEPRARATASTPGQILAPRVCTLVLFSAEGLALKSAFHYFCVFIVYIVVSVSDMPTYVPIIMVWAVSKIVPTTHL